MNYADLNKTIFPKVMAAIALINNPEIAPDIRQLNQEILLREVGTAVYEKIYEMNAFDFEIEYTKGAGINDAYYGLAKTASASVSTGSLGLEMYVNTFLDNMSGQAQQHAFQNAKESGKFPTVTWIPNSDACKYCRSKAGVYTNASADKFYRHNGCTCSVITAGYKTRNGLLNNYVK